MQKFLSALYCLSLALLFSVAAMAQQTPTTPAKPAPQASAPAGGAAQASPYSTDKEKASYAIGMNIGSSLKRDGLDVDPNIVTQGLKDAMSGTPSKISEADAQQAMTNLRNKVMAQRQSEQQQAGDANKKAGDQFLAANKAKPGVVTLPSGLQYTVVKAGTGPKPKATDTVTVNYRGTLIDGTEFDSSQKHGEAATLGVGQVIKGWTEALQLMPVGSKWQLVIPPDLAYGSNGAGGVIGPNSTLVFDIELLSIKGQ
jgi:FKBP-type peptidyl-prolyl cis-trans isomerase FklB